MARKLRLQYEGAVYHVISRGNYRAHVFAQDAMKAAFLRCLDEAAVKAQWRIHAWCVMSNHFHLCLETPLANLVEGMRWLQSTFAIRFNRLRNERGHLFQGRYKGLVVAPEAVGTVCHYIHLNPVRARLTTVEELPRWRWTSMAQLFDARHRPSWVSFDAALTDAGGLVDSPAGRRNYLRYLNWLQEDDVAKKELEFHRMSTDWAIGTRGFKKELLAAHAEYLNERQRSAGSPRDVAEELWAERLRMYLDVLRKTAADVAGSRKGAEWKVAVATAMKSHSTASNPWLAKHLNMGSPFRLSRLAGECRRTPARFSPYVDRIAKCKV